MSFYDGYGSGRSRNWHFWRLYPSTWRRNHVYGRMPLPSSSELWAATLNQVLKSAIPTVVTPLHRLPTFAISDPNPAFNVPVQFTDGSTMRWIIFGILEMGMCLMNKIPSICTKLQGIYTVKLFVSNCFGNAFLEKMVTVQGFPSISITPNTIVETLLVGETFLKNINLTNTGTGSLNYQISTTQFLGHRTDQHPIFCH